MKKMNFLQLFFTISFFGAAKADLGWSDATKGLCKVSSSLENYFEENIKQNSDVRKEIEQFPSKENVANVINKFGASSEGRKVLTFGALRSTVTQATALSYIHPLCKKQEEKESYIRHSIWYASDETADVQSAGINHLVFPAVYKLTSEGIDHISQTDVSQKLATKLPDGVKYYLDKHGKLVIAAAGTQLLNASVTQARQYFSGEKSRRSFGVNVSMVGVNALHQVTCNIVDEQLINSHVNNTLGKMALNAAVQGITLTALIAVFKH
jgi:hypothetical protein